MNQRPPIMDPTATHSPHFTEDERETLRRPFARGYKYLPVELFSTDAGHFVFDAKNVCFLKTNRVGASMLAVLRERHATLQELMDLLPDCPPSDIRENYADLLAMQAEGLLVPYTFHRVPKYDNSLYEPILSEQMGGFTIFITTNCNLGCSYCIYGGQYEQHEKLTEHPMSWETVRNTMDFLRAHSWKSEAVRLDFFGGEPLMAFSMIKRGVEYLKRILGPEGPRVNVTITSNGTVLTDKILDFLLQHNVFLQFSIDGDEDSHDRFRTFKNSTKGSHQKILRNLRRIHDRDADYFRGNVRLKGVITTESLEHDDCEFFAHPLIRTIVDEGNYSFLVEEPNYDLSKDHDYFQRLRVLADRLLQMEGLTSEAEICGQLNVKQASLYRHTFGRFFGAQALNEIYFKGQDSMPFTKACMTGYQEGAVSENGNISICLKSAKGDNFVIGNVNEGRWYFDKMRQLNTSFHEDWAGCSSCYLQKICDLCYEKLNGEPGEFATGRSRFCEFNREKHRVIFDNMLRVAERNPALWLSVDDIVRQRAQQVEHAGKDGGREMAGKHYASLDMGSGL